MINENRKSIARFVPPQRDKSWSFQVVFHDRELPESGVFVSLIQRSLFQLAAKPYLQGHSGNWAMVEYWVKDEAVARKAAAEFAQLFELELKDGDFFRNEVI